MSHIKPNPQTASNSHQEILREKKCINSCSTKRLHTLNYTTSNAGRFSNNSHSFLLNKNLGLNYLKFNKSKSK